MTSILDGVRNILDPNQHNDEKNFTLSIQAAYERIQNNWNGKPSRSKKNWELRFVPLPEDISKQKQGHSHKAEVPLERAIASAFQGKNTIWNQMPVASGLVESSYKDKRRAVDLVYKPDSSKASYEFLELKVANNKHDSPSDATIEIIEYGLLYLFSRHYAKSLGYSPEKTPVLKASHIGLRVLAEMEYYNHWKADGNNF